MGLLNDLFRSSEAALQRVEDEEGRVTQLWEEHLANHKERKRRIQAFSPAELKKSVPSRETIESILSQVESLFSQEFIVVEEEEREDEALIADLRRLTSDENGRETHHLNDRIVRETQKQAVLLALFKKMHEILQVEIQTIRALKKRPLKLEEFLSLLYNLVFVRETSLYRVFDPKNFHQDELDIHEEIKRIAKNILTGKELEDEIESEVDVFVREMMQYMQRTDDNVYRKIGQGIWYALAVKIRAPFSIGTDFIEVMKRLKAEVRDDGLLFSILKEGVENQTPKWNDDELWLAIRAFQRAFELGHFRDLEVDLEQEPE